MNAILKNLIERTFRCRIYRKTLPRGTDLYSDLDLALGLGNFKSVFDVGANVGSVSLEYAAQFPNAEIHAFEPVAETFRTLGDNVRTQRRIRPVNAGMGRSPGEESIYLYPICQLNSILHPPSSTGHPLGSMERIRIESIDHYCAEQSIGSIDFLKIDTEGYESKVIEGAARSLAAGSIGFVLLESEPFDSKGRFVPLEVLARQFAEFGYSCFGIYDQVPLDRSCRVSYFNVLFASKRYLDSRSPAR